MEDPQIVQVSAKQDGLITREQATELGLSKCAIRNRLRAGAWEKILPRVYSVGASGDVFTIRARAASLWGGPAAVLSRRAAAKLLGLTIDTFGVALITNERTHSPAQWLKLYRTETLLPKDVVTTGGIRHTSATRTLIDLSHLEREDRLEELLAEATSLGLTTVDVIRKRLSTLPPNGTRLIRQLLTDENAGLGDSKFEKKVLQVLRRNGLPTPQAQVAVSVGRSNYRIDLGYPESKLAIECDSYRHHTTKRDLERNRRRANALTLVGWRIISVTWQDIGDPTYLIATVKGCLENRRAGYK